MQISLYTNSILGTAKLSDDLTSEIPLYMMHSLMFLQQMNNLNSLMFEVIIVQGTSPISILQRDQVYDVSSLTCKFLGLEA